MPVTIELPPQLEAQLRERAAEGGMDLTEYIIARLEHLERVSSSLAAWRAGRSEPRTGHAVEDFLLEKRQDIEREMQRERRREQERANFARQKAEAAKAEKMAA